MEMPSLSIVTVVYNAAESIEKTLKSVSEQTSGNIEYIIVDGKSTDGTLGILGNYRDHIAKQVSEKDDGIYDAMNKGVSLASGEYVTFLNAGDVYHSPTTVEDVFSDVQISGADVIYGSNYYLKDGEKILQEPRSLSLFYRGMPFNHQSAFVKTSLHRKYPFKHDIYRIQCEYDFLLNLYLNDYRFYCSDTIVAEYAADGFSDQNFLERTLERWLIVKRYGICDEEADQHYLRLVTNALARGAEAPPPPPPKKQGLVRKILASVR